MDTPAWMHAYIPVGVDSGLRRAATGILGRLFPTCLQQAGATLTPASMQACPLAAYRTSSAACSRRRSTTARSSASSAEPLSSPNALHPCRRAFACLLQAGRNDAVVKTTEWYPCPSPLTKPRPPVIHFRLRPDVHGWRGSRCRAIFPWPDSGSPWTGPDRSGGRPRPRRCGRRPCP